MVEVVAVAKKVRQRWLSQGLQVSPINLEELAQVRQARAEGLPDEYETFLRIAGLPGDEDGEGFRFWLPREVRATGDVLGEAGYEIDATASSVIIADYLQESWWYAIWVAGPFSGHVSLVLGRDGDGNPEPPLGTFVDFLLAYLNDDASLYPPALSPDHAGRSQ